MPKPNPESPQKTQQLELPPNCRWVWDEFDNWLILEDGQPALACKSRISGLEGVCHDPIEVLSIGCKFWAAEVERLRWWVEGWGRFNWSNLQGQKRSMGYPIERGYTAQRRQRNAKSQKAAWGAAWSAARKGE